MSKTFRLKCHDDGEGPRVVRGNEQGSRMSIISIPIHLASMAGPPIALSSRDVRLTTATPCHHRCLALRWGCWALRVCAACSRGWRWVVEL